MPSFGLGELILIGVAVIIFIRPEDFPKFVRNMGRIYGDFRRLLTTYQRYTQETLNEISRLESPASPPLEKTTIPENIDYNYGHTPPADETENNLDSQEQTDVKRHSL